MIFDLLATAHDFASADQSKLTDLVCELLRAHRRGHHLLIIPRAECDWLADNLDLNSKERATLSRIRHDFTQAGGLRNKALVRVSIEIAHKSGPVSDGNRIVVGLLDAATFDLTERAQLIVEDSQYDGKLYQAILDAVKNNVQAPAVGFEIRNGGGQSAYQVWKQQIDAKRLTCLLVDSDRDHYDQDEKSEVKRARVDAERAQWPFAWALCLPCREIENLVPFSILEQLPFALDKAAQLHALRRIEETEIAGGVPVEQRFSHYYDMKNGLGDRPLDERLPENVVLWWEGKIAHGGNRPCYTGFGGHIIRHLLEHTPCLQGFLRYVKSESWWNIFGELFALVLWVGFAPRRNAT
ncbi:hypothetical protein [Rhizobium sp. 1399]|uniref:hypothetical protein n=1 Tax=Rhizobium sp. 1399 TaxID=2817758 RepID=UPI00286150E5|nr:hypothetical protein [Rhizobium sp. 1399]MDR6667247.1 hypothetical protein [Rhizobium sp. 1399]